MLITMTGIRMAERGAGAPAPDRPGPQRGGAPAGRAPSLGAALPRPRRRVSTRSCGRPTPARSRSRSSASAPRPSSAIAVERLARRSPTSSSAASIPNDRDRGHDARAARPIARGVDHEFEYRALTRRRARGLAARHRPRRHEPSGPRHPAPRLTVDLTRAQARRGGPPADRGAAPPGPEDGRRRQARGRHRARLQQPAHGHPRRQRPDPAAAVARRARSAPNAEGIREAADQAATLTRQLLAFSRKQVLAPAVLDLNASSPACTRCFDRLLGETIASRHGDRADLGS